MKQDQLDQAIDQVAARLTRVGDNDALASQIINALPDRPAWSLYWLMPRLAITATLAAIAITVVLRTFDERSTAVLRTENASQPAVALGPIVEPLNDRRTIVERPSNERRTTVERPSNDRRTLDAPDFERSLEAIEALSALELDSLAPVSLPEDAPLTLAPLAIADLPLAPEPISPR
jgi:hypothetical protein